MSVYCEVWQGNLLACGSPCASHVGSKGARLESGTGVQDPTAMQVVRLGGALYPWAAAAPAIVGALAFGGRWDSALRAGAGIPVGVPALAGEGSTARCSPSACVSGVEVCAELAMLKHADLYHHWRIAFLAYSVRSAVPFRMYASACSLQQPPYRVTPVSTEFVVMCLVSEALQACSTRSAGSAPRDGVGAPGGGARGGAADALHAGEHERRGWRVWLGSWRRRDSGGQRADAVAAAAASASAALDQASLCCVHPITCGTPVCLRFSTGANLRARCLGTCILRCALMLHSARRMRLASRPHCEPALLVTPTDTRCCRRMRVRLPGARTAQHRRRLRLRCPARSCRSGGCTSGARSRPPWSRCDTHSPGTDCIHVRGACRCAELN